MNNKDIEEDIKKLENYLDEQDRKFVSQYRLRFLQALENILEDRERLKKENEIYKEEYCKITKALDFKEGALNPELSIAIEAIKKALIQEQAKVNKHDRLVERIKEALDFVKTGRDTDSKVKTECLENILKLIKEE